MVNVTIKFISTALNKMENVGGPIYKRSHFFTTTQWFSSFNIGVTCHNLFNLMFNF